MLISEASRSMWANRLDKICAVSGSMVPVGLVVGNIGFESMIGIVGICWLVRAVLIKDRACQRILLHPLVVPWIIWYGSIIISLLLNGPGSKGWAHDIVFFRYLLFGIALLDISKRLPIAKYFLFGLAAGVVWAALNTISAYVMGHDLIGKPLIRYTGKLKEASRISGMSAYAVPFFLTWGILDARLSKKMKAIIISVSLIAFIQLLQTHVRTAILASLVGIFFCTAIFVRRRISTKAALGLVLGILLAVGLFSHYGGMWNLESFYDRIYYWKVTWAIWEEHPVTGVGISSFQDAYKEMAASGKVGGYFAPNGQTYQLPEQTHAHNLFFMVISCTGLFGLAAFVWLFIKALGLVFRNIDGYRIGLVSWPAVFLMIGITGFNIFHSWYQALLAFFLVLIGSEQKKETHG